VSLKRNVTQALEAATSDEGQTMAEYGVVLSVISVATVGIFWALAGSISGAVTRAIDLIPGAS
jgi:Flp pilus assembly pilin Flp